MKPLVSTLALLLAAPALAQPAGGIAQIQAHLRSVETMTADFAQTDRKGKTVTGTLSLKRPGKVRFQYAPGVPLLVVGDGKALTMIDYSVKQVSRWPVGNSPLSVLLDPSRDLARYGRLVGGAPAGVLLFAGRDPRRPEFGTITVAFRQVAGAPAGLRLEGWTVLDAQGNRSAVTLSNQRFNGPISDQTFAWRDPRSRGGAR